MDGLLTPCGKYKRYLGLSDWREHKALKDGAIAEKQLVESADDGNVTAQKALFDQTRKMSPKSAGRKKKPTARQGLSPDASSSETLKNVFGLVGGSKK